MFKILKPEVHGILDYALALMFFLMPSVFDFPAMAANLSYGVGVVYIATSLVTRYPLGAWKLIPFPVHGALETMMAMLWLAAPWLFSFAEHAAARNFFLIAGFGLLAVVAVTDYKSRQIRPHLLRHA